MTTCHFSERWREPEIVRGSGTVSDGGVVWVGVGVVLGAGEDLVPPQVGFSDQR